MLTHSSRLSLNIILISVIAIAVLTLSRITSHLTPVFAVGIIVALIIAALSFINQDIAAIAIIFSMLLSPELKIASLPKREVVIRFDDIILIVFFFTWLFKMAYYKNLNLIKITPLNVPIAAYIIIALISTWSALSSGAIIPAKSLLYFLKYAEYFMIYFMFSNIIQREEQLKIYIAAFFVVAAVVSIFGLYQIIIGVPRISAPFEGPIGEANTLGGYLLLVIGITAMATLKTPNLKMMLAFSAVTVFLIVLLFATYSRASYLGLLVLSIACIVFARKRHKPILVIMLIVFTLVSPFIMPRRVIDRVSRAFQGDTEQVLPFINLNPSDSPYLKVKSIENTLEKWKESPVIGKGVTGVGFVDTQYPLILGELGALGMLAYIWIVASIFAAFKKTNKAMGRYEEKRVWFWQAIATGFICGFTGIIAHGIGANTFIIIRIMEPFWFLTAVVVALPHALEAKLAVQVPKKPPERKYALQPWLEKW